jgi:hypothetical protein
VRRGWLRAAGPGRDCEAAAPLRRGRPALNFTVRARLGRRRLRYLTCQPSPAHTGSQTCTEAKGNITSLPVCCSSGRSQLKRSASVLAALSCSEWASLVRPGSGCVWCAVGARRGRRARCDRTRPLTGLQQLLERAVRREWFCAAGGRQCAPAAPVWSGRPALDVTVRSHAGRFRVA